MRVAYVCTDPGIPVYGTKGCSLHVQEILRALVARGYRVELFAVRIGGNAPRGCESVRHHQIPVAKTSTAAQREQAIACAGQHLAAMLELQRPIDLIYERHSLWSAAAMQWAKAQKIPSILEVNAPLIMEQANHRTLVDYPTCRRLAEESLWAAGVVACVSNHITQYAEALGADPSRTIVVPNGVRPERFVQRPYRQDASAPFTIGFVGALRPWHAVGDLVTAFAAMSSTPEEGEARLVIVGDGPQRERLNSQIAALPKHTRSRIQMVGSVSPEDVPGWLARFDAAVAPYDSGDTCYFSPLKLYEYMAAGVPTVAAAAGQMCDVIDPGVNGLVYQPGSIRELRDRLEWLRSDPDFAASIGENARREVLEYHSWDQRLALMLEAAGLSRAVPMR